ncbi:Fe-S cluster assembly protein SufD [Methylobrevis albus]|uniref:Fe-S cluster assembly protein SufD n=1 Tax=Methylobrevis albus TaxID=2793297 RepID=A0A931I466_9HYPH|nr:Fe-S cluster assembly protein SufD [Methylobrevis albus]MBH0239159.1 Fe-S cluster assembly protein SufD [Methylobrevis albus]
MSAEPIRMKTPAEEGFPAVFDAAAAGLPGTPDIAAARRAAIALVRDEGLPHRRIEAYHYTDLRALVRSVPPLAIFAADATGAALTDAATVIGFTNGRLTKTPEALPAGVILQSFVEAASAGSITLPTPAGLADSVSSLNTAFASDGAMLYVAPAGDAAAVIELQSAVVGGGQAHLAHRVTVAAGAKLLLIDRTSGPADTDYLASGSLTLVVEDGAEVTLVRLQREGDKATRFDRLDISLGEGSKIALHSVSLGAKLWRFEIGLSITGDDAEAQLFGAGLLQGRQHGDTTLFVDHAALRGTSKETFKSVATDEAKAVFQGKILVRPGAQKTDGKMMANALLLSERAEFMTKPELEIFADDVACGHGATCGEIDENHLFYLMARGVPKPVAEQLLIAAFVEEVFDDVPDEALKAALAAEVDGWLAGRAAG